MEPQKTPGTPSDDQPNANPPEMTSRDTTLLPATDQVNPDLAQPAEATKIDSPAQSSTPEASTPGAPGQPETSEASVPAETTVVVPEEPGVSATGNNTSSLPTDTQVSPSLEVVPSMTDEIVPDALPVMAAKSRKKSLIIGSIIVAALLMLFGGGAAAYYYVVNKPANVLLRALSNALDEEKVQTVHFSGAFNITEAGSSDMTIKATYTGASDGKTGAMDINATVDAMVTKPTFELRSTDGKSFYIKLGGLKGLPELLDTTTGVDELGTAYGSLITAVNDQWFEINESLIKQAAGGQTGDQLSKADRKKLAETYKQHAFVVVKTVLADEKIKGTDSYHYKVVIDKTRLKEFVAALQKANITGLKITDKQVKGFDSSIADVKLDKYPVDIWIAKGSKLITQVAAKASQDQTVADFSLTIDSYNKPVIVEKPADAKSLLEILGPLLGGQSGDSELFGLGSGVSL